MNNKQDNWDKLKQVYSILGGGTATDKTDPLVVMWWIKKQLKEMEPND